MAHVECITDDHKTVYTHEQIERGTRRGNGYLYHVCFPCPTCQGKYYADKPGLRRIVELNSRAIGSMPDKPMTDEEAARSAGLTCDAYADTVYRGGM